MLPVILRSERVRLDLPTRADVAAIAEACQDEAVQRYTTVPTPYSQRDAQRFVDALVGPGWASGDELTWAVRRTDSTWLQGVISLRAKHHDVGFWTAPWGRRQGRTAEAVRLVVEYAEEERGWDDVYWECFVGNVGSASVARAAGFVHTGTGEGLYPNRDGSPSTVWKGLHRRDADAAPGLPWPEESFPAGTDRDASAGTADGASAGTAESR